MKVMQLCSISIMSSKSILPNGQKSNAAGAKAFADFMVSKNTQEIIKKYGVEKYGSPLFFPDAGKNADNLGK